MSCQSFDEEQLLMRLAVYKDWADTSPYPENSICHNPRRHPEKRLLNMPTFRATGDAIVVTAPHSQQACNWKLRFDHVRGETKRIGSESCMIITNIIPPAIEAVDSSMSKFMYKHQIHILRRNIVIHNRYPVHLVLFLRQHLPDLPPLSLDHSHSPDLLGSPRISYTFDLHLNDIALDAFLLPARFEVVVCVELGEFDDPRI
jgi:hypothetical protein